MAVLVAIAIPIFTTQLEKSKEGTDIANLRSAYAAGQVAAMTGYVGDSSIAATVNLKYNPNVDGALDGTGISIGQGTKTDGKADTTALTGGIVTYDTTSDVKGKTISVGISDGVLVGVAFDN